ncbi:MAG: DUF721 domain-containing protein [Alphaproteobacteria bacterium]|nr:DUF721 domain-containing protein [Alphaproteobacteria bacterium]
MSQEDAPRRGGMRAVGAALPSVTKGAMAKRGFAEARILLDWRTIVGETLARHTVPERLARPRGEGGGVLHIRVAGAFALELQHLEPIVIERINAHFGHAAVARLKMTQGLTAPTVTPRRRRRQLGAAAEAELSRSVERIGDSRLKEALARLGRAILTEEPEA